MPLLKRTISRSGSTHNVTYRPSFAFGDNARGGLSRPSQQGSLFESLFQFDRNFCQDRFSPRMLQLFRIAENL